MQDPKQDILVGLLRLRKCSDTVFRPELSGRCSIVRELHVYGNVVPVHSRDPTKFQHQVRAVRRAAGTVPSNRAGRASPQGFGLLLMEAVERIARDEHHSRRLAVISGVGTRDYYRKLGYVLEGCYMVKDLAACADAAECCWC